MQKLQDHQNFIDSNFLESEILRAKEENALPFMVSATAGNY